MNHQVFMLGDATNKTLTQIFLNFSATNTSLESTLTIASHHCADTHGSNSSWWNSVNLQKTSFIPREHMKDINTLNAPSYVDITPTSYQSGESLCLTSLRKAMLVFQE